MRKAIALISAQVMFLCAFSQSTFTITSSGTTPEIEAAIDFTTGIWSQYLNSEVPIEINITYADFSAQGFLGQSFPNSEQNFTLAPHTDVWYVSSLANSIAGFDLSPGEVDMDISITNTVNWYFGTDGNCGANQFDFVSVLLHEIGHGLGFISLGVKAGNVGTIGMLGAADLPLLAFPFPDSFEGHPSVWDLFMVTGDGLDVSDPQNFANGSVALGAQMTSNNLYFSGADATAANLGVNPKLYAPSSFSFGSSLLHFNENSFPLSSGNSLMTPFSDTGEVEHLPGSIALGTLVDIGWSVNVSAGVQEYAEKAIHIYPNPSRGDLYIDLNAKAFDLQVIDMLGNIVVGGLGNGLNKLDGLGNGSYLVTGIVDGRNVSERIVLIK